MRVLEKKNEEKLSIQLKHLVDSEDMPTSKELKECSTLIMESTITEQQELELRAIAIKICKTANAVYKEGIALAKVSTEFKLLEAEAEAEAEIILKQNNFYEKALRLYLIAQQWAQNMPLKSYRRAKLLAQIDENIGKFNALITARKIFFEVLMTNYDKYPHNLVAATIISNWSKIVLTRTEISPVDTSSSDFKHMVKSSKNIIYEFLMNYPLHECNLLKVDDREDPDTYLAAAEVVNTFISNYRDTGFFNNLSFLPIAKDSPNEQQSSLNFS